ncbi:hypothetical protein SH1V18_18800 [Vallitalea longa]|uniref:Uroporphyrinogen decarboxylase (URO-D) domain-containing protein n=1 Tax=Vallitalea longa TaxID=2936439 RepID=A0A9W6DED4_9FIRM|nr:uroporphyrinogen decarboxylase family protein [Vallitalea longa]GKX29400.1 hypothetical protein SH1V18_18800 [Vallitalea longa]
MTGKERLTATFNRQKTDRNPFWKGNPTIETEEILCNHFNIPMDDKIALSEKCNDDFVWLSGEMAWRHPNGEGVFESVIGQRKTLGEGGKYADVSLEDVDKIEWPNPKYIDVDEYINILERANEKGLAVFGGMWSPFFHLVCDFFGMENYFIKMYTEPLVVEAVTNKIVDFYLQANKRIFEACKGKDILFGFFFGNDFGSQLDTLISPELFRKFVLPSFKKLVDLAKEYDLFVMLHSCGSIYKVIPDLISTGMDALHPIQAKAKGMSAEELVQYKDDIIFVGGVDTQELLPNGTPGDIINEVKRLKRVFGDGFVVSPSHEALQSDVPLENILALKEVATEI